MNEYPEHDRLAAIRDQSQSVGEFLDVFLPSKGIVLAEPDPESVSGRLWPIHRSIESLLAEFFGIDQKKLEAEKQQMFDALREMNRTRT